MGVIARGAARGVVGVLVAAAAALGAQNVLLNTAVPMLVNRRPERLRIDYTVAWMIVPGQVHVLGLRIRNQGLGDQWLITADRASGVVGLRGLFERRFEASDLDAEGVSLRYRRRADAPPARATPDDPSALVLEVEPPEQVTVDEPAPLVVSGTDPPIPGLVNPPDPNPDLLYPRPKDPWLVTLGDIRADVREIWVGDHRLVGDASASGDVTFSGQQLELDGELSIVGMRGQIGEVPVAEAVAGELSLVVAMDRANPGPDPLRGFSGQGRVSADVQDLRFVDFYLAAVPWLSLAGTGHVDADVAVDQGLFRLGSTVHASFPGLLVRVLTNSVSGAGELHAEVIAADDGAPQARIEVDLSDFSIRQDGAPGTLVRGVGFHVDARSPDLWLDQPFATLTVVLDLPESSVPDLTAYNVYLPQGLGLSLRGGTGTVRGRLVASSASNVASGDLHLDGHGVVAQYDEITMTGDVAIHGKLTEAHFDTGIWDLSGSTVDLRKVGLVDGSHADKRDGERLWSASLVLPSGVIRVGAPIYLDANIRMTCSDSVPFMTLFAQKKPLPQWVQGLLSVRDVSGEARLRLGTSTLEVDPCTITGGSYGIDLRYRRDGRVTDGDLLARAGPLSVGIALRQKAAELQLFGARRWFESRGAATAPLETPAEEGAPPPVAESDPDRKQKRRDKKRAEDALPATPAVSPAAGERG